MSDSASPEPPHARLPCPSLSLRVSSNSSTESVMLSNHLVLCHPLLLLPSIFPSISILPNELALLFTWSKYQSFSFSISPSNRYSGWISCRIDWFDLAVQGTLKSSFQYYSVKNQPICLQCRKIFVLFCNFLTDDDGIMWILVKQIWPKVNSTLAIFISEHICTSEHWFYILTWNIPKYLFCS